MTERVLKYVMPMGLVHIYTGDGKGKTTAAVGLAVRAKSRGLRVLFAQFMKDGEGGGETRLLREIGVEVLSFDRVLSPVFHPALDRDEARREALKAVETLKKRFHGFDLAVLDEFNCVLAEGFINLDEAVSLIEEKPDRLELVLTGRGAPEAMIEHADHVTEMKDVKHPFHEGLRARMGIDY